MLRKGNELLAVPCSPILIVTEVPTSGRYRQIPGFCTHGTFVFPRQRNKPLTALSRFHAGCRRRYLQLVGTILFPGTFPMERLYYRTSFIPSRAVLGTEQQVHNGPVMLRIFFMGVPMPIVCSSSFLSFHKKSMHHFVHGKLGSLPKVPKNRNWFKSTKPGKPREEKSIFLPTYQGIVGRSKSNLFVLFC